MDAVPSAPDVPEPEVPEEPPPLSSLELIATWVVASPSTPTKAPLAMGRRVSNVPRGCIGVSPVAGSLTSPAVQFVPSRPSTRSRSGPVPTTRQRTITPSTGEATSVPLTARSMRVHVFPVGQVSFALIGASRSAPTVVAARPSAGAAASSASPSRAGARAKRAG